MIMVDVPSREQVLRKSPIILYAAAPGAELIDLDDGVPIGPELETLGWRQVKVKCNSDNRKITARGYQCTRQQYSLRHTGASTITKQTGNTIHGKCAIEVSRSCAPWDKPGVVVMLSRTTKGCNIIIVTEDVDFAIESMWESITKENQWTDHIENLLH